MAEGAHPRGKPLEPPSKCAEHNNAFLVCQDSVTDHSGHKFEFLSNCAPESRKALRHSLAPLRKVAADMADAMNTLVSEETKVEKQKEEVTRSIQQSFDQLKAVLDQRKTELVEKASSLAQEKKEALAAQKKVLQVAQEEVQVIVEWNMERASDQDLMSIQKKLQTKMEEVEKRHQQLSLELAATADITCNLPSLDIIPECLGVVYDQSSPPQLFNMNTNSVELCSPVVVSLSAPTASLEDISASLKCVADPSSSLEGGVVQSGKGIFNISVTPLARGRRDLTVKVKGREIAGSPFQIFVKLSPSELGRDRPQRISGVNQPWGIAFNEKQQLVVGERKTISVLERDGRKVQTIECDQFHDIRGVAVAPDGTVYVSDLYSEILFKFDSKGNLLKSVGEIRQPHSVKIIDSQLYVIDDAVAVTILDMDFNLVGTIMVKECPIPQDIAQGPEGLYVAGHRKISLYRCAPDGVFIRHLNLSPSLDLSFFNGICYYASSGHIIASDQSFGVYVFKPSGECVGHVSRFIVPRPAGVTVDDDGFVYVCSSTGSDVVVM